MAAGEAKAATRGAGRRTKVKGRIVVTPSRHRPAWGPANGRQTEKEKLAQKKFEREREAAENAVALQAQELEREFEVSSAARDERRPSHGHDLRGPVLATSGSGGVARGC